MTAREYLGQIQDLQLDIRRRCNRLEELYSSALAIGSFDYSRDRVQVSPSPDAPYTRMIEKIAALRDELDGMDARLITMVTIMNKILDQTLTEDEAEIVRLRYYTDLRWTDIMKETGYKDRTLFRMHNRAMEKLDAQDVVV